MATAGIHSFAISPPTRSERSHGVFACGNVFALTPVLIPPVKQRKCRCSWRGAHKEHRIAVVTAWDNAYLGAPVLAAGVVFAFSNCSALRPNALSTPVAII